MYGVCASTPERRRELMELCIAKINVTYDVKLTLDVLVEFQTSVPTSVERATALALSQIERGTAASRLSVWQTNDISNHSPNAMVTNQGFVQPQKLCAPPHVGSGIIVAAPFSSHLLFGFGQNDVSPTNEEAEVEELFKEILNARSHHELFRTAHATSSAEAHVPFPFWNAPLVPQSSAVVNNVYRPHTELQTNVEQAAALTAIPPRTVNGLVTSRVASWPTNNTTTQTHPILIPSRVLRTEAPQFVPPGTSSLHSPVQKCDRGGKKTKV